MNAPEHSQQNRRLGLILCLLFIGLFAIVTATIITGSKTPPLIGKIMGGIISPVLGVIGLLLIIGAGVEIVFEILKRKESLVSNLVAPLLSVLGLLLIIGAVVEVVFEILKKGGRPVSDLVVPIIFGILGLLLIIGAGVLKRYSDPPKNLK